jgi:hypothetical protein
MLLDLVKCLIDPSSRHSDMILKLKIERMAKGYVHILRDRILEEKIFKYENLIDLKVQLP